MNNEKRLRYVRRWAVLAIASLVIAMVATRPNVASEVQHQYFQNTLQCLNWFFSNHPEHETECVGDNDPSNASPNFQGSGTGTFTPPPPPRGGKKGGKKDKDDEEEEEPDEEEECEDPESSVPRFAAAGSISECREDTGFLAPIVIDLFGNVINV